MKALMMKATKTTAKGAIAAAVIAAVISLEGGYVNDPKDPGGETNFGITKNVALANGYKGSMKDMPKEVAQSIYYKDYIEKPNFTPFLTLSPPVAEKLIDAGVNTGPRRPSCWIQHTLNTLNRNGLDYPTIQEDCIVGNSTISSYRSLVQKRGRVQACELTLKMLDAQQATYYSSLTGLKDFMVGWMTNRIGNVPLSKCSLSYGDSD